MGRCGPRLNTWFLGTQPPQVHTKQHLDWFNHSSTDTQTCTNIQSHNTCNNRLHLLCNADWQSVVMPVSSLWQRNSTLNHMTLSALVLHVLRTASGFIFLIQFSLVTVMSFRIISCVFFVVFCMMFMCSVCLYFTVLP